MINLKSGYQYKNSLCDLLCHHVDNECNKVLCYVIPQQIKSIPKIYLQPVQNGVSWRLQRFGEKRGNSKKMLNIAGNTGAVDNHP